MPSTPQGLETPQHERGAGSMDSTIARRPTGRPPGPSRPLRERFLSMVEQTPTCWYWTARIDRDGYSRIKIDGRPVPAYRVAYELLVGPIPDGLEIDHACHNVDPTCSGGKTCRHRACVNPAHLEPVTGRENLARRDGHRTPDSFMATPMQWGELGRYPRKKTAVVTASRIRMGTASPGWAPGGSFDARWEADGDEFVVFARYMGGVA